MGGHCLRKKIPFNSGCISCSSFVYFGGVVNLRSSSFSVFVMGVVVVVVDISSGSQNLSESVELFRSINNCNLGCKWDIAVK